MDNRESDQISKKNLTKIRIIRNALVLGISVHYTKIPHDKLKDKIMEDVAKSSKHICCWSKSKNTYFSKTLMSVFQRMN